jgi:hypothetical protein
MPKVVELALKIYFRCSPPLAPHFTVEEYPTFDLVLLSCEKAFKF